MSCGIAVFDSSITILISVPSESSLTAIILLSFFSIYKSYIFLINLGFCTSGGNSTISIWSSPVSSFWPIIIFALNLAFPSPVSYKLSRSSVFIKYPRDGKSGPIRYLSTSSLIVISLFSKTAIIESHTLCILCEGILVT